MERLLDLRGLLCPIPLMRTREAMPLDAGDVLVVLATDPEAPVDIGALARDQRCSCAVERNGDAWKITLRR